MFCFAFIVQLTIFEKKNYVHDGTLKTEEVYELYGYHLEADKRVGFMLSMQIL